MCLEFPSAGVDTAEPPQLAESLSQGLSVIQSYEFRLLEYAFKQH